MLGLASCTHLAAAQMTMWADDGWGTPFADDDSSGSGNYYVGPGWGGEDFDAEYLYSKIDGDTLYIGLQTGFNVDSGVVNYSGTNYYAGDIALSFDGDDSVYEYAVDFGKFTKDYYNHNVDADNPAADDNSGDGEDDAGVYENVVWNNHVYDGFTSSSPFAMGGGDVVAGAMTGTTSGYDAVSGSYYRTVAISLSALGVTAASAHAHWTMSCGNDEIDGAFSHVPPPTGGNEIMEPATFGLMGIGAFLLMAGRRRG